MLGHNARKLACPVGLCTVLLKDELEVAESIYFIAILTQNLRTAYVQQKHELQNYQNLVNSPKFILRLIFHKIG